MAVTKRQAETVFAGVKNRYRAHLEGLPEDSLDYPKLIKNWTPYWGGPPIPWVVMWESGPYGWASRYSMGGFDEELSLLAAEFVGPERAREKARNGEFTEQPGPCPVGVFIETGNDFVLCLYPNE